MDLPREELPEGTEIAGYIIGQVLGRGGFGITYIAVDALHPDQRFAIKEFLPEGLAARERGGISVHPSSSDKAEAYARGLARFELEARTLVALRHPHIVEALRFVRANGTAYLIMKYEEGRSLRRILDKKKTLPEVDLRRILPPLLDGLEMVHARAFLHRDIKPENIYLRSKDGSPVLLDFGAARQALAAGGTTSLTQIFTPGYAPYEQYNQSSKQGPYTDIYALGATLYRCVTGQRPPDASERFPAAAGRMPDPMKPAREAAKGKYDPALLKAIDRALAVFESDRPQTVAEFRNLLGLAAPEAAPGAGQSGAVKPSGTINLGNKKDESARPKRARILVAAVAAVLLISGGLFALSQWSDNRAALLAAEKAQDAQRRAAEEARKKREAAERRDRDETERRRLEEEAKKKADEERRQAVASLFLCTNRSLQPKERVEACTRAIERGELKNDELARAYAYRCDAYDDLEEYRRAIDDCDKALTFSPAYSYALKVRGVVYIKLKDFVRAIIDFDRVIELDPDASTYKNRGDSYLAMSQYHSAIRDYDKALELDRRFATAYMARGNAYDGLGQYARALQDYDRAIGIDPRYALAYFNRGDTQEKVGNREAAIRDFREALRLGYAPASDRLKRLGVAVP